MNKPDPKTITEALAAARSAFAQSQYAQGMVPLRKAAAPWPPLAAKVEALEAEFFYMLRFLASGHAVNQPEKTLDSIAERAAVIAHCIELELSALTDSSMLSGLLRYARMRPEENIQSLISDYLAEQARLATDTAAITDPKHRAGLERIATDIFNRLWCVFPLDDETSTLILSIITDDSIPEHDRTLWTNALGLAFHSYPTADGAELLMQICEQSELLAIKAAASAWLLLGLHVDSKRPKAMSTSASLLERLKASGPLPSLLTREWAQSLSTANLGADFLEISGRMNKLGRKFLDKLRNSGDDAMTPERMMDQADMLSGSIDPKQFEEIKRFNEAQLNGADVFMATIGKMRHFDFFRTAANWFLPFDAWHSALAEVTEADGAAIADTISRITTLCDSDKYALMLSLGQAPASMRQQALQGISSQMMEMTHSDEFAEALGAKPTEEAAAANAIKNIYRFFNVFDNRIEFLNTLAEWPEREIEYFIADNKTILKMADMLYGARCFRAASQCYQLLLKRGETLGRPETEKLAASLASIRNYDMAIDLYRDILNEYPADNNRAVRMNLARIYMLQGKHQQASELLQDGIADNNDNIAYINLAAEAAVAAGRWKDAADIYYMLDYATTDNNADVKTDLAWALTVNADFDDADAVFSNIDAAPTPALMRRRALLYWLSGNTSQAMALAAQIAPEAYARPDTLYAKGHEHLLNDSKYGSAVRLYDSALHYLRNGSTFGKLM